jgi:alcohol dehydrogenase class IV
MLDSFILSYPAKIIFGPGKLSELPDNLGFASGKILLVTGNHAVKSGLRDKVLAILKDYQVFAESGINPEPPLEDVERLVNTGREKQVQAVIAIGGGSVIDTAKAAAAIIPLTGTVADYFHGKKEIPAKGLFFAALPTTAGTGAEITKNSVLTDVDSKVKKSLRHPSMVPDLALIDPELNLSASPSLTAASGLDAFTQAVESYLSVNANAVTKSLAKGAVEKIFHNLETAFKEPDNLKARTAMAEGSLMSAMAFSQSGLGAVHGLAHPIGSLLKVPHGVACAILLLPVLKWNLSAKEDDFRELAAVCEGNSAEDFVNSVSKLCRGLNIPESFADYGLSEEHFPFIVENCRSNSMKCNPRYMKDEDVITMLEKLK